MLILGFLLASTVLILVLGFLVQFKSYQKTLRLVLLGLGGLFVAHLWISYLSVFARSPLDWFQYQKIIQSLGLLIALALLELTRHFLRDDDLETQWTWGHSRISIFSIAILGASIAIVLIWIPGTVVPGGDVATPLIRFTGLGLFIPSIRALIAIYTLYLLESTFRFSVDYQRRIARLGFIGLGCLSGFHLLYFAHVLLYRTLPAHFAEASSVVYGVIYPVVLAGFLRYRLGSERISIPRDTVYTSATVFLTGAAFLGVASTILIFQWLELDFNYFERFLLGFSLCVLAVLVLGSGTMRRRISRYVNEQFYSRKYDYQEQFFRLHKTAMSGADVDSALTELVENMKYSVTVDDAYFFILNWQDGNFYQHENKEEATRRGLVISGDSPLSRMLSQEALPVDLLAHDDEGLARRTAAREEPLVYQLKIDAIFPIFIGERLAGFLALQGGRKASFDGEDLDLIAVFTTSIGDVLFKNRVLKERIEQKQFESFHHVASFIIHDIKNQIATLNLLLKNAERNLGNPSFQTSMLTSVKSCAVNLQSLIDRLSVAPERQGAVLADHALKPLLEEVIANSGLSSLPNLTFEFKSPETQLDGVDAPGSLDEAGRLQETVPMDRKSLFFVVRNLINNSLEAMQNKVSDMRLSLSYGPLGLTVPGRLRELFGGGDRFFAGYSAYILVEDNGAGMDKDFVRRRLFQPFATTKEKGVGIGLYQCKTLVEKMGGRILCHSEPGRGTEFCILLPAKKNSD
jgi:signal transduction histidine kinase